MNLNMIIKCLRVRIQIWIFPESPKINPGLPESSNVRLPLTQMKGYYYESYSNGYNCSKMSLSWKTFLEVKNQNSFLWPKFSFIKLFYSPLLIQITENKEEIRSKQWKHMSVSHKKCKYWGLHNVAKYGGKKWWNILWGNQWVTFQTYF